MAPPLRLCAFARGWFLRSGGGSRKGAKTQGTRREARLLWRHFILKDNQSRARRTGLPRRPENRYRIYFSKTISLSHSFILYFAPVLFHQTTGDPLSGWRSTYNGVSNNALSDSAVITSRVSPQATRRPSLIRAMRSANSAARLISCVTISAP